MDAKSLVSFGFFPKELPPPFTTTNLGEYFTDNKQTAAQLRKQLVTQPAIHNLARPGGLRRRLQIPNPFNYYRVCSLLEKYSDLIKKHFSQSIYTLSLPVADPSARRALKPQADGIELGLRRAAVRSAARFSLKADISRFYGSIYTNSIIWALEGKNLAKVKTGSPANQLHEALRDLQDGQTVGIPIGPDASLVIAEIIACAIDQILAEHQLVGMRFMDDYEFGFASRPDAEAGLVLLEDTLADFELAINPQKTTIASLPVDMERGWISEIQAYPFPEKTEISQSELMKYFNRVFEWKTRYPSDAVLAYAVARLRSVRISDWKLLQDLVCQCALAEPGAMEPVVTLLQEHGDNDFTDALDKLIAGTIDYHAPISHGSEVAWALWASIWFKRNIPSGVARKLVQNRDAAVAVLSLHAKEMGLIGNDVSFSDWIASLSVDSFYNSQWLFAYEADIKGWLSSGQKSLANEDPLFSRLKSDGISFFDPNIKAPTKTLLDAKESSIYQ